MVDRCDPRVVGRLYALLISGLRLDRRLYFSGRSQRSDKTFMLQPSAAGDFGLPDLPGKSEIKAIACVNDRQIIIYDLPTTRGCDPAFREYDSGLRKMRAIL